MKIYKLWIEDEYQDIHGNWYPFELEQEIEASSFEEAIKQLTELYAGIPEDVIRANTIEVGN